ncbi:MAG: (2Fe-2S) ferredoxin domain-containing protein [Candidatus Peregrinibacteria bacterium]
MAEAIPGENGKKKKKEYLVSVCTSPKACKKRASQYVWERCCNEHGITDFTVESFEDGGITFRQTQCLGLCKQGPNVKVAEEQDGKDASFFSWMNPIKMAKLMKRLRSGNDPKDIKNF